MNAFVTSETAILAFLTSAVALSFYILRFKWAVWIGPALAAVVIGIVLSNLNILPHAHKVYGVFMTYAIPLSLTMMLLSVNLKEWIQLAGKPLLAMGCAVGSVAVVTIIVSIFLAAKIPEGWKIAGMLIGTYTGGSSNLTAIGTGLNATPTTFGSVNAADYVVGIPSLLLFFALPSIIARSKWFQKWWPYSLQEATDGSEEKQELFAEKKWSITDIAILFAIAFIVTSFSTYLSGFFPELYSSAMRIIFVTTFAIILAQYKPVRKLKGNVDLGVFIALFFLVIIGLSIDIKAFASSAPLITVFCFFVIFGSFLLHVLLCRMFKIEYQYVLISVVASIADGTTSAMVAGSAKWHSVIGTAIILGSIGSALGNYIGLGTAYLIRSIIGA